MVGLIAKYGTKIIFATGPTRQAAEEIALHLFAECGYNLKGIQVPMVVFNPAETGGLVFDSMDTDPFGANEDLSMDNWTTDGYLGPDPSGGR